jgi:branched-chain amino acid transport system substrate-binding protein
VPQLRGLLRATVIAALAAAGWSCGGGGPIKIGAVLPLTGHAAVYGKPIQEGVELAYELSGHKIGDKAAELVVVDSQSDPDRAKSELRKLYDDGAIVAIGGVTSAEALAMVEVADSKGRTLVSPSASQPQLTGISENFYRVFPSDFAEGTVMARYAYDNLRLRNGVILAKEETYAKGIQQIFTDEFTRKGGKIVETIEFPASMGDFTALADRAVTLKPDFVYVAAYAPEILRLVKDLRTEKFPGIILTTSSFASSDILAKAGDAAEGVYLTQTSFDTDGDLAPNVADFVKAYRDRYHHDPDLYAAHGFDAYNVLGEAYRQGGTTALSFWKGMRGVREFPGVTGTLQFDEKGDVQKFPHVYIVRNGKAINIERERQEQIKKAREEMERLQKELDQLRNQSGS